MSQPKMYIIAGPNGAGKTTVAQRLVPGLLHCIEYVNADEIAKGLSPFNPEKMAIRAGRLQMQRILQLIHERTDFAVETTLATRTYLRLIKLAHACGYKIYLFFFRLPCHEMALSRVAERVAAGGHNIAHDVVVRRYQMGLSNLFKLYMPVVDHWFIINNEFIPGSIIAEKAIDNEQILYNQDLFILIEKEAENYG